MVDGDEESREYAPQRVAALLASLGISVTSADVMAVQPNDVLEEGQFHKLVRRVLRVFRRTTSLTDNIIKVKFKNDIAEIKDQVLPLMEQNGIVLSTLYHGGGAPQEGWKLEVILEDLLAADGSQDNGSLAAFWREVARIDS